jgi:hypothetical protein
MFYVGHRPKYTRTKVGAFAQLGRVIVMISICTSCNFKDNKLENTEWFYDYFLNDKNERKQIRLFDKFAQAIKFKKNNKYEDCYFYQGELSNCTEAKGIHDVPLERNFWKINRDTLYLPKSTDLIISLNYDSMVLQHLNIKDGKYYLLKNKFVYKRIHKNK